MAAKREYLVDVVPVKFSGGKMATVAIPKLIRDRLSIRVGARLSVCIDEEDRIILSVLKDEIPTGGDQ
jgi:hypothetical protein